MNSITDKIIGAITIVVTGIFILYMSDLARNIPMYFDIENSDYNKNTVVIAIGLFTAGLSVAIFLFSKYQETYNNRAAMVSSIVTTFTATSSAILIIFSFGEYNISVVICQIAIEVILLFAWHSFSLNIKPQEL